MSYGLLPRSLSWTLSVVLVSVNLPIVLGGAEGGMFPWLVRWSALSAYALLFLAIVSSALKRHIGSLMGIPFLKYHHGLAVAGLILATVHPLSVAIGFGSAVILLPPLTSLRDFFAWGGSPAWVLFVLSAAAARFRRRLPRWRSVHRLSYVAFLLATVHALHVGTDLESPIMRGIFIVMAAVVLIIFLMSWRRGAGR